MVKKAGFKIPDDVILPEDDVLPSRTPVMGNLRDLIYDYYFASRDGAERVMNTQGAQVVMQLLQSMLQIPPLAEKMGLKNIYDMANTVIRMSGAPLNFQFELPAGESEKLPETDAKQDKAIQAIGQQLAQMQQMLMQVMQGSAQPGAQGQVPAPAGPPAVAALPPNGAAGAAQPANAQLLQEPVAA